MAAVWSDPEAIKFLNRKSERICLAARNWDGWRYSLGEWHTRPEIAGYHAFLQDKLSMEVAFLTIDVPRETLNMEPIARRAVELIEQGIGLLERRENERLGNRISPAGRSIITNQRQLREG